jgi:hypothetical protein
MRIGGVVSTDELDKQGERIVQSGLDFGPFLSQGWFNDNHGQKTTDVLGYPSEAKYVRKGERLPNGSTAEANGWWAEGYLLNTTEGRRVWDLCQAMTKGPRSLGFSIEGKVKNRSKKNNTIITQATVKNVAITHCPVNGGTEMHALVKALTAGSAIDSAGIGTGPGDGGALRRESLEGGAYDQQDDEEEETPETETLTGADGDDPNDGGWAGVNPHKTPITKAQEAPQGAIDEIDALDSWVPHLQAIATPRNRSTTLTKAEARIIVRSERPNLSTAAVDAIVTRSQNLSENRK